MQHLVPNDHVFYRPHDLHYLQEVPDVLDLQEEALKAESAGSTAMVPDAAVDCAPKTADVEPAKAPQQAQSSLPGCAQVSLPSPAFRHKGYARMLVGTSECMRWFEFFEVTGENYF